MGFLFSKQKKEGTKKEKNETKKEKSETKKEKKRAGKNNPRNEGSTQSLNLSGIEVSLNPTGHEYAQSENFKDQSQSCEELSGETKPFLPPRNPSTPLPPPDHRKQAAPAAVSATSHQQDAENYLQEREEKGVSPKKLDTDNVYDFPELNSKPQVRAERNYEANDDTEISFRKGDILLLFKDRETADWYFVRNLTTEKEGYAPKTWVTLIRPTGNDGNDVESQKCFFKRLNRYEAKEKLSEPKVQTGTYLLRPSEDGYALSLRCENELNEMEIKHYKVRIAERGICYIETDRPTNSKPFGNITELIKYYTDKPGLRCKLKSPLPQDVPLSDLTVKRSDLKIGDKLGAGNFGSVYAGTLHENKQVAVKFLNEKGLMTVEQFRKEAETMHVLRHPSLVSLLGICEESGKIIIITELMSKGTLLNLLREDIDHTVKFKDLMQMAIQVVDGMCYLERKGFVHRDLRAANVLVGDGYITKIADFGLTRLLDNYYQHEDSYQQKKGSDFPYKWTAPEAIKQLRFTVKSDVWSFGILLYEMVTHGDEPYAAMSNAEALEWVEKGNRLKRPQESHCPATLYNIMTQCWMIKSEDRPNFADIKEMLVEIKTIA